MGADARQGIWPHRDATTAYIIARERGYHDIAVVIEQGEAARRRLASPPEATIDSKTDQINRAILGDRCEEAIKLLESDLSLVGACNVGQPINGIDCRRLAQGTTPLHVAAWKHNPQMIAWLLDRGALVDARDGHGHTPLDTAATVAGWSAHGRNFSFLENSVEEGDEIVEGAPLWFASMCGRYEIAELLISRRADVNAVLNGNGDAMCCAETTGDQQMESLLLRHGARITVERVAGKKDRTTARAILEGRMPGSSLNVEQPTLTDLAEQMLWAAGGCDPEIVRMCLTCLPVPEDIEGFMALPVVAALLSAWVLIRPGQRWAPWTCIAFFILGLGLGVYFYQVAAERTISSGGGLFVRRELLLIAKQKLDANPTLTGRARDRERHPPGSRRYYLESVPLSFTAKKQSPRDRPLRFIELPAAVCANPSTPAAANMPCRFRIVDMALCKLV